MLIIFGRRHYGKIDAHGGQFAVTKFFHVYYVPLIPLETIWVTDTHGGEVWGHPVASSGRSVLAGYARVWGPIAVVGGVAGVATGGLIGIPFAVAGAAAAVWSWGRRSLRRDRDRLRSDFHLHAYGTRCDPLNMADEMAHNLRELTDARWAKVSDGATPEDIARRGSTDTRQAVFAYGVLRLAARLAPREAASAARAASEEILTRFAGAEVRSLEGGPYRAPG